MRFNDRLVEMRNEKGISQKACAEQLGVAPSKYNKWESGVNHPNYETVCLLADHFGVTTDYLLGRSSVRDPANHQLNVDTGLNDESINRLKENKDKPILDPRMYTSNPPEKHRIWSEVLNDFIDSPSFDYLILHLGILTDPSVDNMHGIRYVLNPDNTIPAKKFYRTMVQQSLDEIIEHMEQRKKSSR